MALALFTRELFNLSDWRVQAVLGLLGVLVLGSIVRRFRRAVRGRRAPVLNPRLTRYAGYSEEQAAADRLAAAHIIATSSTGAAAGFEIVRQIEAVYIDGCRSPEEALLSLKAAAARLGANAVVNLAQHRTAAGRCTAQGDAVLVRPH